MAQIGGVYGPLSASQVRLIRLSADIDDPVCGQLEVVTLANAFPYYALSHAWVEGEALEKIRDSGGIRLGRNLSACVRRLQRLSVENPKLDPPLTHIWLDRICINQADVHERSSQVALMGSIYSQSIRTIIWLGQEDLPSCCCAWELIADIYTVFRKQNPAAVALSDIAVRTYDDHSHIALGLPPWHDIRWAYLKRLMGLRWFSRMWIVQEVVLSQHDPIFLHGEHRYAWESLGWAVAWMRR